MPHWKSMMDRDFIYAFDLNGRDVVVTIVRVTGGTIAGDGGRKSKKPVAFFEGKEKGLALNATNCKTIAKLFGSNDTDKWIGKQITLYPTTTEMAGETRDCIRVRPTPPAAQRKANGARKPDATDAAAPPTDAPISAEEQAEIERLEAQRADP